MGSKADKMGMYDQHILIIGGENGDMGINWDIKGISPTISNSGYFGVYPTCHFHLRLVLRRRFRSRWSSPRDHQPTRVCHAAIAQVCSWFIRAINHDEHNLDQLWLNDMRKYCWEEKNTKKSSWGQPPDCGDWSTPRSTVVLTEEF